MINAIYPPPLPNTVFLPHCQARIISGAALTWALNGNVVLNGSWIQGGSNGDTFEYQFALAAGTYTLLTRGIARSNAGLLDWTIDGNTVGTDDFYAAVQNNALQLTQTGIVIAATADGLHTLRGTVNGKNASSSGYRIDAVYHTLIEE